MAPTGSGKTKAAIDWCKWRNNQEGALSLLIYAAPTIALIDQMIGDLKVAGLRYEKYTDVWPSKLPLDGVIVTTNHSLGRILKLVNEANMPYYLILDEIHQGLDEFMKSNYRNKVLEDGLVKSNQTLLLTGTLTDVQRTKIPDVVGHALSGLTEAHFCTYEFAPVKRNPLAIRSTEQFDSDFMRLIEYLSSQQKAEEELPRVVILLDTSKLNAYRAMLAQHGLTDQAHIVSRQENTQEQIEAARVSLLPILIASPLFALGLNFDRAPDILLCRFSGISADMSQIIQTVNRGNRNHVECQVIIYGNPEKGLEFKIPNSDRLKAEIARQLGEESSFTGLLEDHFHVDRVTYQLLRQAERNSFVALSKLVEHDMIQNYTVAEEVEPPKFDRKKAAVFKEQKKASRADYLDAISENAALFNGAEAYLCFWKLEKLAIERRENFLSENPRVEREIKDEELGAVMALCNLKGPQEASKVNIGKVRRLFGELSPWISAQYDRETYPDWAKIEAEKTEKLVVLLEKLNGLKTRTATALDLVSGLTRNQQLVDAFLSLASTDADYIMLVTKFKVLKKAREAARKSGSEKSRIDVQTTGLKLLRGLLEALGVAYGKKRNDKGKSVVDYESPIVPATWNLPEMALNLTRQAIRLKALPIDQKVAVVSEDDYDRLHPGQKAVSLGICQGCVFFHQNSCVQGRRVAWQGDDNEFNLAESCAEFRGWKATIRA